MTEPVGIFGGTFDPIHFGHLRPALEVMEALALGEVRFVPNRVPPHRDTPRVGPEARVEMLRLALSEQTGFRVDERELRRDGPSYTVDTLTELRCELGASRPLCLILGMDAFLGLPTWHRWRELLELAHLVVARRPGAGEVVATELDAVARPRTTRDPSGLSRSPSGSIHHVNVSQLAISATGLRQLLARGGSGRYLMPETVWRHIHRTGLYLSDGT